MNTIGLRNIISIGVLISLATVFVANEICSQTSQPAATTANEYPKEVKLINKNQANYDTPENTMAAIESAMKAGDLKWYYETMTKEAELKLKKIDEKQTDNEKIKELKKNGKETKKIEIVEKRVIKDKAAVLLVVKHYATDNAIIQLPHVFIIESNKWKLTYKFNSEEWFKDIIQLPPEN